MAANGSILGYYGDIRNERYEKLRLVMPLSGYTAKVSNTAALAPVRHSLFNLLIMCFIWNRKFSLIFEKSTR